MKLILRQFQSPGDIVMLTAAVRDLHRAYPGRYLTDVRTSAPDLWHHNPNITPIADDDPAARTIACHYPLIHQSNQRPIHFIQAFTAFLNDTLGTRIATTDFHGDIHLSDEERGWISQVAERVGEPLPFWLITAGGKYDFTAKWWDPARFQQVVDAFAGKILFVQVGAAEHHHPRLKGCLDLIGRTDLRQLVRLVHHAQGVVTPVSLLMHLAAAVPPPPGAPPRRPCVVVAGGREPPQWEAYPAHQFIHTVGALPCCADGGCWKSRVAPIGDGDEKDRPENLCVAPVASGAVTLPRCLDLITADHVVDRIAGYFRGGAVEFLKPPQSARVASLLP